MNSNNLLGFLRSFAWKNFQALTEPARKIEWYVIGYKGDLRGEEMGIMYTQVIEKIH